MYNVTPTNIRLVIAMITVLWVTNINLLLITAELYTKLKPMNTRINYRND